MALPHLYVKRLVEAALREDLGDAGDITAVATIPAQAVARGAIVARENGVLAGAEFARAAFHHMDASIKCTMEKQDGAPLKAGDVIMHSEGNARALVSAERVALNFLGKLCGIASLTARYVACARAGGQAHICDTRKTTPGLRMAEKYAVRMGGGVNHRFGLYDAILIKDNHIVSAGGVTPALIQAQKTCGHMVAIEIEVDTLAQLEEALAAGAKIILLDNMPPAMLREAVALTAGRAVLESSGRVSLDAVTDIAASGVDYISVGRLTHSAPTLDIGLDFSV